MLECRLAGLDEVGKLESPLERTGRDAAMQIIALILVFGALAGDGELILLGNDLDIVRSETGDGQCDAIAVLAVPHDDEALQYCRTHQNVDLVFTDVQMPGSMDGIALVAQLRELNPFLPIILTSGALTEDEVAGIPFIRKPYDLASAQRLVCSTLMVKPRGEQ